MPIFDNNFTFVFAEINNINILTELSINIYSVVIIFWSFLIADSIVWHARIAHFILAG